LRAILDWSYALLTDVERIVLCGLAVFRGAFDLDAAKAIAGDAAVAPTQVTEALTNLVAKSLVSSEIVDGAPHYRLLETTRAYALEKLAIAAGNETNARRHAIQHREPRPFEAASHSIGIPMSTEASLLFDA
jgi:predicted ATPase